MALRNAFAEMFTERTGRLILAAVQYARDANDRMRVVVDSGTINSVTLLNGSATAGTYRLWNDPYTAFVVDQREIVRQQSLMAGHQRRQKWSYS